MERICIHGVHGILVLFWLLHFILGTLFLFVYWPSLNGALVDGTAQQRASVNTFYALAASCAATFSFTVLASNESRFNIVSYTLIHCVQAGIT